MVALSAFELLVDGHFALAESPVYDDRTDELLWVDITEGTLHAVGLTSRKARAWHFGQAIGCFGLAESGRVIVALRHSVELFDRETGTRTPVAELPHAHHEMRSNDGKVGPDGAFWISTMDDRAIKEPLGAVYRVDRSGYVEAKIEDLLISNGLAWTADGRAMFHTDTRGPWIDRWDFDAETGTISGRTRIARLDDAAGRPDGGACDAEGCYWSAGVSAARINRFSRDGVLMGRFDAPVPRPTMPCFGGKDMSTLFITTASHGLTPDQTARFPHAGGVFQAHCNVAGVPAFRFKD